MTKQAENIYDPIIRMIVEEYFPELLEHFGPCGWLWSKAQIWQESRFDPMAVSPAGAMGLMQLMPGTAAEMGVTNPHSPVQSINGGVRYLAQQYRRLSEIPPYGSRLRLALAAYNGGRGYVNVALALARKAERLPYGFRAWRRSGSLPGQWQTWKQARHFLADPACQMRGRRPDHKQMIDYVERIHERAQHYLREHAAEGEGG